MPHTEPTTEHGFEPDRIGEWSERKISIVTKYAQAYSHILRRHRLRYYYIDGLTGGGVALRKDTSDVVQTTARRILEIEPPFHGYHLIDFDPDKFEAMRIACQRRPHATAYCGDANELLPSIFETIRYDDYRRALCFLDPYKILLSWHVLCAAGRARTIEAFINFPTHDVQRNVLRNRYESIAAVGIRRMNVMWGDESWRDVAYARRPTLFDDVMQKQPIEHLLSAFKDRLKHVAGFKYVSSALPMRNSNGAVVYHLLFVTQQEVALKIAEAVLKRESLPRPHGYQFD